MKATAKKLGSSPLLFDWTGLSAGGTGQTSDSDNAQLVSSWNHLKTRLHSQDAGFFDTPVDGAMSELLSTQELARSFIQNTRFEHCLFLGIGGSSLGPKSLLSALSHLQTTNASGASRTRSLKFAFQESPDPLEWNETLQTLSPESTCVCIVTKSGTTLETMALATLAMKWLGKERWNQIIAITDPEKGDLRLLANREKWKTLSIHPSLGGRYSVFSPVGLFALELSGFDSSLFLKGASEIRSFCEKESPENNPLCIVAQKLVQKFSEQPIHICMPYSSKLKGYAEWWVQLWGESLGKNSRGFTPVSATGPQDQHSLLQLMKEGPNDKITKFIQIGQYNDPVDLNMTGDLGPFRNLESFKILDGHSLERLLHVELLATARVLEKNNRPYYRIELSQLDLRSLGALYFAETVMTAFAGTYWNINPFDQPGVEEGKQYARHALNPPENISDNPIDAFSERS